MLVYQHKTLDMNIIFYVGVGKTKRRAFRLDNRTEFHANIVKKHGIVVEILYENLDLEKAYEIEKKLIKLYGRRDKGTGILVNMTDGGDGHRNPSEESRRKQGLAQSKALKGRFIGELNSMYGKHQSEEFKQKKREYFLSDKNPGKNKSEETKKKISKSKMGMPSPFKGIPRKRIICPHCSKEGGEGLMQRWHFNNCKFKTA
jgi:hypothetical protein